VGAYRCMIPKHARSDNPLEMEDIENHSTAAFEEKYAMAVLFMACSTG